MSIAETFNGYIETTQDSLLVLEACRRCLLPKISRRLQEKERKLVRSGSVFVFDEKDSGIKRWTDGLVWSPSRILGNFLIYRELDKRIPKRKRALVDSGHTRLRSNSADQSTTDRHKERQLVGSLSDAYNFKEDGLIKKTMSLIVDGTPLHLISYYHPEDVVARKLRTPSAVPELVNLEISPELLVRQNFRIPPVVEPDQYAQPYYQTSSGYTAAAGQLAKSTPASRSLSLPSTDYMHHPMYTRHNSISQFNHSTPYTENNYHQQQQQHQQQHQQQQQQQQQEDHLPQLMQHRGSVESDRSKPVFDPMYNVTTYTLPSPTSSPNTPLPVSMTSNPSSSMMAPPPTEPSNNSTNNTSVSYHPSSSYPYDYSRLQQQQKPATGNHGRILNLPTLARQEHTSINSLLSNDSPTYHPEAHQHQGHNGHHEQQQQQYHATPDQDLHHSTLNHPDYYGTNAAHGLHHQHSDHNHSSNGSAHLPQPMTRLYSLDDSAMQWI